MPAAPVPVTPRAAALRILEQRYGAAAKEPPPRRTFDLAAFQEDAVRRARAILRERGGVLIADSVGLGKTYVALALVEEALRGGGRVLVVTPAALRTQWRTPLRRLGFQARVVWVSHTRLSRGLPAYEAGAADAAGRLVVVDEAHAFRNPRTRRYRELARLCRGARVVLLTATPINNTLLDLYAQIRLFAGDGAFRDLGVADLRTAFRAAAANPEQANASSIGSVVRALMVRRTRPLVRDLLERAGGGAVAGVRFPRLVVHPALRYELRSAYPTALEEALSLIEALRFAPFRTDAYRLSARGQADSLRPQPATGAVELLRILLLKRLESSVAAFTASLTAQIRYHEAFLAHLAEGHLLAPRDHRSLRGGSDAEGAQLILGALALQPLPRGIDGSALARDVGEDLGRLHALRARLDPAAELDPKLARLRMLLGSTLAGERVLVFTEFRETARHLWIALRDGGGVAMIHGGGAFLGRSPCGRHEVVIRFAPAANRAPAPPPHEKVRLLIATDVLSEGLNLQDARHVISYDLPWNPVRLIQRIGRIDRLGSAHARVYAHTFLPDDAVDGLLRLLDRIHAKLTAIRAGVGDEPSPLDASTESPDVLAVPSVQGTDGTRPAPAEIVGRLARGDTLMLDDVERRDAAPFEAEERLRIAWLEQSDREREDEPPAAPAPASNAPVGAVVIDAVPPASIRLLLAVRVRGHVRLLTLAGDGAGRIDAPESFELLRRILQSSAPPRPEAADKPAGAGEPAPAGWDGRGTAPALAPDPLVTAAGLECAHRLLAPAERTGSLVARASTTGRAIRRLLRALGQVPGGPAAALCDRVESIVAKLSEGLPAGAERELLGVTTATGDAPDVEALCARIEAILAESAGWRPPAGARVTDGAVEWIGAIEVRAPGP